MNETCGREGSPDVIVEAMRGRVMFFEEDFVNLAATRNVVGKTSSKSDTREGESLQLLMTALTDAPYIILLDDADDEGLKRVLLPRTSHLAPHTSHLTLHTSHLAPRTSHLTPHTSHLTPHTSHLTPAPGAAAPSRLPQGMRHIHHVADAGRSGRRQGARRRRRQQRHHAVRPRGQALHGAGEPAALGARVQSAYAQGPLQPAR